MIIYQVKIQTIDVHDKVDNVECKLTLCSTRNDAMKLAHDLAREYMENHRHEMPCEQKKDDPLFRARTRYTWSYDHDESFKICTIEVIKSKLDLEQPIIFETKFLGWNS